MSWILTIVFVVAIYGVARGLEPRLRPLVGKLWTWQAFLALVIVAIVLVVLFQWRSSHLEASGCGDLGFDGQLTGYDQEYVERALAGDQACRSFYAATELTLDLLFPATYLLLFMLALTWLIGRPGAAPSWLLGRATVLPVATACSDVVENVLVAMMALAGWAFAPVVWLASSATRAKWLFYGATLVAVFLLGRRLWAILLEYLLLVRVPVLCYGALLALAMLGAPGEGQPTIENMVRVGSGWGLFLATFQALIACAVIGVSILLTWRMAPLRFGVPALPVPSWLDGWSIRQLALLLAMAAPLILRFHGSSTVEGKLWWLGAGLLVGLGTLFLVSWIRSIPVVSRLGDKLVQQGSMLGDGYEVPEGSASGHGMSLSIGALLVFVYGLGYWLIDPAQARVSVPTIAFVLLLVTMFCSILSGLAFLLDRYRVPLMLGVLVYALVMGAKFPRDHFFELRRETGDEARPPSIEEALQARLDKQAAGPVKVLTVVGASGGGIQAAGWTTQVMTGLQEELGADFIRTVQLISSASGGSVGAYFYLEGFEGPDGAPSENLLGDIRRASMASSLEETAWGLAFPDFLRAFAPAFAQDRDRAWAIERAWLYNLACMKKRIDPERCSEPLPAETAGTRVGDWRRRAATGELPGVVFNATVVEMAQQFLLSSVDLTGLPELSFDPALWSHREQIRDIRGFYEPAGSEKVSYDLEKVTAARLSASFPVVSPVAAARNPERESLTAWHITDGGFFDNFGTTISVLWLRRALEILEGEPIKVLYIQINAFPETAAAQPSPNQGWVGGALAPLETIVAARTSTQTIRNDNELGLLETLCAAKRVECQGVTFRPPAYTDRRDPPLSWELSESDKQQILEDWRDESNQHRVRWIEQWLDEPAEQVGAPEVVAEPGSAAEGE